MSRHIFYILEIFNKAGTLVERLAKEGLILELVMAGNDKHRKNKRAFDSLAPLICSLAFTRSLLSQAAWQI
jgi:hypothetical protein